ncbi:MAG: bifunctional folylpolyglutamate synthase/dihydrofolate synthase [Candidatus Methanolliviera hydrocarbonicum]|uniref:Probable bifunctional folylpolyglutamate synthase/dihydropteroate synthase n=1 Tax=Candidatus Methanolliviera hydrocarbonicum TaxID=2491085 RepID=A0A520KXZ7_9EURY|nr:MAG: bifunctional folylpolyglutamate synthase/dihydrofolate synthase [Candidatus Methanolliviera hydrocarbonicum]
MKDIDWLFSLRRFGINLGLERIKKLLERMEHPEKKYDLIHIGGTNGKGSVCTFIGSILSESGYKTGVYTSPSLNKIEERFVIDGKNISREDLLEIIGEIRHHAEELGATFFEVTTAIALRYFQLERVDFAVLEVGLGGRFDATNAVKPIVSVITNVFKDHTDILGDEISDIAFEKAGIIKEGVPVITGCAEDALGVIRDVSNERGSEVRLRKGFKRLYFGKEFQIFEIDGYKLKTGLLGEYQGENLSLALGVADYLKEMGYTIKEEAVARGVEEAKINGRLEFIEDILLDGAHNRRGIEVLFKTLREFNYERLILILGILADKDINGMISEIRADVVITTRSKNPRSADPEKIAEKFKGCEKVFITRDIEEAMGLAKDIASKGDLICVTGSLYLVGEARVILYGC